MALTRATDKIIANADGNLNLAGIVTASSFSGSLVPSGDVNVGNNIKLGAASGIVTATSFSGDGSNLTSLPAGLGTALSSTQTSPLNKLYYTNRVLSIASTTTVDHPATGTGAYTQYADIQIEDNADLIIEDGDDLIPDILGLGDNGSTGAGGLGRLRVDTITNKTANGAPNFPNGLTGTAATFTNSSTIAGIVTLTSGGVDTVGVVTATSFKGAATNLTSIPAANITGTLPAISGANLTNLNGSNISSGIVTSARLGGGTASNSTFLRGDGTFAEAGGGIILQTINATTSSQVENTSGSYYDTNLSANITLTAANKVLIFVAQSLEARQYNATGFSVGRLKLVRTTSGTATDIFNGGRSVVTSGPGSGSYFVASGCIASIVAEDSPGVGTHNYKTRIARIVGGGGTAVRANSDGHPAEIILMEVKV